METEQQIDFWFSHPPGALFLEQEKRVLHDYLSDITGDRLLQFGGPSDLSAVASAAFAEKVYASIDGSMHAAVPTLNVDLNAFSLPADEFDCVVLFHCLSYAKDPAGTIQCLSHGLKPGGHLIIFELSALSLSGVARWGKQAKNYPWSAGFVSQRSLFEWLTKANLEKTIQQPVCYRGPAISVQQWRRKRYQEMLFSLLFTQFSSIDMVCAVKRSCPLTPLIPKRHASGGSVGESYAKPKMLNQSEVD